MGREGVFMTKRKRIERAAAILELVIVILTFVILAFAMHSNPAPQRQPGLRYEARFLF